MILSTDIIGIHPTRLELLKLRRRKALADGIIDILNKDLEALMATLFKLLKEINLFRGKVSEVLDQAYNSFVEAEMIIGSKKIEEVSLTTRPIDLDLSVDTLSGVLGIPLPRFQLTERPIGTIYPRFSILDTPAKLDESLTKVYDIFSLIMKLAETEASIRKILEVISVKRRQVNRLQYKVLPELDGAIRYIELILEETERQDAIRIRVLQRKRKERALKSI